MSRKALVAIGLAACMTMTVGLTACQSEGENSTSESQTPTSTSTPKVVDESEDVSSEPDVEATTETAETAEQIEQTEIADSLACIGTVESIEKDESGQVKSLYLSSEDAGDYIMKVSDSTIWVDCSEKDKAQADSLSEGDTVYVFYDPIATKSAPPQSNAYAIILNADPEVGVAYHKVEDIVTNGELFTITTNNGGLYLNVTSDTQVKDYDTGEYAEIAYVDRGDYIIAWYPAVGLSYPGVANATDILVLPTK